MGEDEKSTKEYGRNVGKKKWEEKNEDRKMEENLRKRQETTTNSRDNSQLSEILFALRDLCLVSICLSAWWSG